MELFCMCVRTGFNFLLLFQSLTTATTTKHVSGF